LSKPLTLHCAVEVPCSGWTSSSACWPLAVDHRQQKKLGSAAVAAAFVVAAAFAAGLGHLDSSGHASLNLSA